MENKSLCQKCGGQCCKNISGLYTKEQIPNWWADISSGNLEIAYLPVFSDKEIAHLDSAEGQREFKELQSLTLQYMPGLREELEKQGVVVLWAIRPSSRKPKRYYTVQFFKCAKSKGCVQHGNKGCRLSYEERPQQCKDLEPKCVNGVFECDTPGKNKNEEYIKFFSTWESEYTDIQRTVVNNLYNDVWDALEELKAKELDVEKTLQTMVYRLGLNQEELVGIADLFIMMFENNIGGFAELLTGEGE